MITSSLFWPVAAVAAVSAASPTVPSATPNGPWGADFAGAPVPIQILLSQDGAFKDGRLYLALTEGRGDARGRSAATREELAPASPPVSPP